MTIGCLTQKTETAIAPGLALKLTLKLVRQSRSKQASDRGLTLIEGLIAIIIVTITVVSISPPIFWATASRVQTRRAEQALQLAQGEIDRVRAMIDRGDITTANVVDLPPTKAGFDEAQARDPSQALAPNAAKTAGIVTSAKDSQCQSAQQQRDGDVRAGIPTDIRQYIQVDLNADCQADFLVQTFRSEGLDSTGAQVVANNT
jgi:type II secretory pathway pseudopilin PulG